MNLLRGPQPRRVVRTFGRDSLLLWLNPMLSALQAFLGIRVGLRSEAEVLQKMEEDALRMADKGYRVVSADRCEVPLIGKRQRKGHVLRSDVRARWRRQPGVTHDFARLTPETDPWEVHGWPDRACQLEPPPRKPAAKKQGTDG
jgi:hypothetical protein